MILTQVSINEAYLLDLSYVFGIIDGSKDLVHYCELKDLQKYYNMALFFKSKIDRCMKSGLHDFFETLVDRFLDDEFQKQSLRVKFPQWFKRVVGKAKGFNILYKAVDLISSQTELKDLIDGVVVGEKLNSFSYIMDFLKTNDDKTMIFEEPGIADRKELYQEMGLESANYNNGLSLVYQTIKGVYERLGFIKSMVSSEIRVVQDRLKNLRLFK